MEEIVMLNENAKRIKALKTIAEDMKNDARDFDGKPFTGKTVATYLAYQGAAISALADILRGVINDTA